MVNEVKGEGKEEAGSKASCARQRPFSGENCARGVESVVGGGLTATAAREQLRGANDPNRICVIGHRKKLRWLRWLLGRNTSAV